MTLYIPRKLHIEDRPSVAEGGISERFSCAVSSPTNQEITMIHCSGNALIQSILRRYSTICIDNNLNRLTCDLSVIVWFCHPQLISVPNGEAVYNIFHNIDCSGNTNSNEVVKLKEDVTIPNSKTHVGSPGHFSYMAKYLALLRANQIFTNIY